MSNFQLVEAEVPAEHALTKAVIVRDTDRASVLVNTPTGPRTTVPSSVVTVAPPPPPPPPPTTTTTTLVVAVEMVAAQVLVLQARVGVSDFCPFLLLRVCVLLLFYVSLDYCCFMYLWIIVVLCIFGLHV